MYGLLWLDKTEEMDFSLFDNFKTALKNYLKVEILLVNKLEDLSKIKTLLVVDEYFYYHREFILDNSVKSKINERDIKLVMFNTEKIFKQPFKVNEDIYNQINQFNNKIHILSDALDIQKLSTPFPNKQLLSKDFEYDYLNENKQNELIFIGQVDGRAYKNRRKILKKVESFINIPFVIQNTKRKLEYNEFLNILSKYKFVLNPLGNGRSQFLNVRYYEAVRLKCIPVQEITKNMLQHYKELQVLQSINFFNVKDLKKVDFNSVNFKDELIKDVPLSLEKYFESVDLINIIE